MPGAPSSVLCSLRSDAPPRVQEPGRFSHSHADYTAQRATGECAKTDIDIGTCQIRWAMNRRKELIGTSSHIVCSVSKEERFKEQTQGKTV